MKFLIKQIISEDLLGMIRLLRIEADKKKLLKNTQLNVNKIVGDLAGHQLFLELGSGPKKGDNGWLTLDLSAECDLYWDLLLPLPFPENSVDTIYSSHVLEHFSYKDLIRLLSSCYEVLKDGGKFRVCVPDASIYIKGYLNSQEFIAEDYCKYIPAFNFHSEIDYINYIAYMDSEHRHMFDSKNLIAILQKIGFKDVKLRQFDPLIDRLERDYESIYAEAEK
jgi:predicted SAM-dependent methyltransferase